jgi:hypothetical protein
MDRMEIVDKEDIMRYRLVGDSIFSPERCQHRIDDTTDRCRFCRVSRAQLEAISQQQDPSHNQF